MYSCLFDYVIMTRGIFMLGVYWKFLRFKHSLDVVYTKIGKFTFFACQNKWKLQKCYKWSAYNYMMTLDTDSVIPS